MSTLVYSPKLCGHSGGDVLIFEDVNEGADGLVGGCASIGNENSVWHFVLCIN